MIDTGSLNNGAGPDFLGAHLRINNKDWYGSVEIHKKAGEWFEHNHHEDEEFNSVVLHVIFDDTGTKRVYTEDRHEPFTFVLKPHLTEKVYKLLEVKQKQGIACSGNISFINQEAFEKQVARVHQEYFEYKVEELLEYYDPSLPLSTAWLNCLITGIYRTLGIPSNKTQMADLAQEVLKACEVDQKALGFKAQVEELAFHSEKNFQWIFTGMRPASSPQKRVGQAASLQYAIHQISFENFFKNEIEETWNQILQHVDPVHAPGQSRLSLIKQLVYLPALYLLGDLLHSKNIKQSALGAWSSSAQHVPGEIKTPFKKAGFDINSSTKKIGLAHQYKRYCRQKNCHKCEVFKKAIRS